VSVDTGGQQMLHPQDMISFPRSFGLYWSVMDISVMPEETKKKVNAQL